MKRIVLGMLALTLAFASNAQTEKRQGKQAFKSEKKAFKGKENYENLNLTEAQKQKLKSVNEDFRNKMQDLKKNENVTVKDQREKREQLMTQHKQQLASILTPDQLKQVESHKPSHGVKGGGKGNKKIKDLGKDMNLSADQSSKIKSLKEGFKEKRQAIHKNASISQEQKKEQMKSLSQQHKQDVQAVLSNEQKQQMKNRIKDRPNRKAVK